MTKRDFQGHTSPLKGSLSEMKRLHKNFYHRSDVQFAFQGFIRTTKT